MQMESLPTCQYEGRLHRFPKLFLSLFDPVFIRIWNAVSWNVFVWASVLASPQTKGDLPSSMRSSVTRHVSCCFFFCHDLRLRRLRFHGTCRCLLWSRVITLMLQQHKTEVLIQPLPNLCLLDGEPGPHQTSYSDSDQQILENMRWSALDFRSV